jgi:hypothetical protein
MADIDEKRINGNAYGWSSVLWKIGDDRIHGFKAIAYKDSRERTPVYGSGRHHAPRGQTPGKYAAEPCTATVEKETAALIRAALARRSADGKSFGNVEFEIVVQREEDRGGTPKVITDELHRCTWRETASKAEEGSDPDYEEIAFNVTTIDWDGLSLYDGTGGAP